MSRIPRALGGSPLKSSKYKKLIWARLGVSGPIYVNVDSPNLGFPYFIFLGGYPVKTKITLYMDGASEKNTLYMDGR